MMHTSSAQPRSVGQGAEAQKRRDPQGEAGRAVCWCVGVSDGKLPWEDHGIGMNIMGICHGNTDEDGNLLVIVDPGLINSNYPQYRFNRRVPPFRSVDISLF